MKKLGLLVTLMYLISACGSHNSEDHVDGEAMHEDHDIATHSEEGSNEEWAEAESFHEIMALTYHPMKDEGKIEVVSENAAELLEKAKMWAGAEVPAGLDADHITEHIDILIEEAEELVELVANEASDDELTQKVNDIHDVFHEIQEIMESGDHGDHED